MRSNHSLSKQQIPVGVERKLLEDWQDDYQSWICLGDPKLASSYSKQRREAAEWVGTSPPTYTPPCVRAGRHRLHSSQVTNVPKAVAAPWSNYAFHASNGWLSNIGHTRIVMWTAECSIQCAELFSYPTWTEMCISMLFIVRKTRREKWICKTDGGGEVCLQGQKITFILCSVEDPDMSSNMSTVILTGRPAGKAPKPKHFPFLQ